MGATVSFEITMPFPTVKDYRCFESIGRSSDSLWGEERPSFFFIISVEFAPILLKICA